MCMQRSTNHTSKEDHFSSGLSKMYALKKNISNQNGVFKVFTRDKHPHILIYSFECLKLEMYKNQTYFEETESREEKWRKANLK